MEKRIDLRICFLDSEDKAEWEEVLDVRAIGPTLQVETDANTTIHFPLCRIAWYKTITRD